MRIRLMFVFVIFFIMVHNILLPFFSEMAHFFDKDFSDYEYFVTVTESETISTTDNEMVVVKIARDYGKFLKTYISISLENIKDSFRSFNLYKWCILCIAAYLFSRLFYKPYSAICNTVDDIKEEDFSSILAESTYYPELVKKLNQLSVKLEKEKEDHMKTNDENQRTLNDVLQQTQKFIGIAKGNLEVVSQSGMIPENSYEAVLFSKALDNISRAAHMNAFCENTSNQELETESHSVEIISQ